ncbi:MAG: major tail protein [Bacteriophage sp.]|nr:MAG: major tail protein [Bacteriophage sp.]
MQATFYQFAKRTNSTKRPSGGQEFGIDLKAPCNIIDPEIKIATQNDPTGYNYCYLPTFSRYYWVKNWTYADGLWDASLTVDTLASYRDQIGNSTEYVTRSSAQYDGTISDGLYPATAEVRSVTSAFQGGFSETISGGFFVIGFIAKAANSIGAITYVVMTPENAKKLSAKLLTDVSYLSIDNAEISDSLTKVLFNPYQYIVSCNYFPFDIAELTAHLPLVSNVDVGWWSIDIPCWILGADNNNLTKSVSAGIPKHPQAASRGGYCNASPYTDYTIFLQPFGVIPLDASKLWGAATLSIQYTVDLFTGDSILRVFTDTNQLVHETTAKLGVPIQLSNITFDIPSGSGGLLHTGIAAAFGGIQAALSGGSFSDVGNGILNAAQATNADVASKGATGSTIAFDSVPYMVARFKILVDDNNEDHGRPLCKRVQLSTIPGYIMVDDPDIALAATAEEIDSVKSYLKNGFFYE